jgi:hypothetical protein
MNWKVNLFRWLYLCTEEIVGRERPSAHKNDYKLILQICGWQADCVRREYNRILYISSSPKCTRLIDRRSFLFLFRVERLEKKWKLIHKKIYNIIKHFFYTLQIYVFIEFSSMNISMHSMLCPHYISVSITCMQSACGTVIEWKRERGEMRLIVY